MQRLIVIGLGLLAVGAGSDWFNHHYSAHNHASFAVVAPVHANDDALSDAYRHRKSDIQVRARGRVSRILADDNDGSRHQRFIVTLASGQTLLIAHNIDLAPRIPSLSLGDDVEFHGEYEWNAKGGVVHWTHHDPKGRHTDGWLKHQGRVYK